MHKGTYEKWTQRNKGTVGHEEQRVQRNSGTEQQRNRETLEQEAAQRNRGIARRNRRNGGKDYLSNTAFSEKG